jgi:DNA (cytosine-5)-methyltransferase 1
MSSGLVVDLFAGGGGASTGIEAALNQPVDVALNHDEIALDVHRANHPQTRHLTKNVWKAKPLDVTGGRRVGVMWASPDCTHHSLAKGGKPLKKNIRALAWVVCRWAQEVEPEVIFLENVAEFRTWGPLDRTGRPIKARKGETFRRWVRQLERLGYVVDYRMLDASLYGAPTRRRRLFLVARHDGQPIRWPEPTHGPGKLPLRTAAECIDWSLHCPSIFGRKRPLADKTLWRIAQGLRRFVFENPRPFIVKFQQNSIGQEVSAPLDTVMPGAQRFGVSTPLLVKVNHGKQEARSEALDEPMSTVTATQRGHALVCAFLAKHFTERAGGFCGGQQLDLPVGAVTTKDHHGLAAATLARLPAIAAQGNHVADVRAFLAVYYGDDAGQSLLEPLRTITAKHRLGLVTIQGHEYQIVDIGLRMLEPHELARAQFGRFADGYDLSRALTKSKKVQLIGNSVCPEVAEALVRVNVGRREERAA